MDIKFTKQPDGYWVVIDADNYEVEVDSEHSWSHSPVGYGKTEIEAIRDLLDAIVEQAEELLAKHQGRANA